MTTTLALKAGRNVLANRDRFADLVLSGQSVENSTGSLRGRPGDFVGFGVLPNELRPDVPASYVIYSYATPIAWREADTGRWVVPDARYSVTTSQHQSTVRVALRDVL